MKLSLIKVTIFSFFMMLFANIALADQHDTIVDKAIGDKDLSTLVTAIKAAGLVDTLNGSGPFTVFAPTNEAFAKLPKNVLNNLLKDKKALTEILTYHVVPGDIMSQDIQNGDVKTVEGQTITVRKDTNGVFVNNAKVVQADIKASNGVIHVIDTVLIPPKK